MDCQSDKFSLDNNHTYLNGAYMSPILKSSEEAGIRGLMRKRSPGNISRNDFFDDVNKVRALFARLINSDEPKRIVVIPSASYALANVARNLPRNGRNKILLLEDQFPSNYYIWKQLAKERQLEIRIIPRCVDQKQSWSDHILENLDPQVLAISLPIIHWSDGTMFDIENICKKAQNLGTKVIIDGTQSIGVLPYDQMRVQADALIVSAYKWLLGPYCIGLAYYGPSFDQGIPVEESWLNRVKSDDFQFLTNYQEEYRQGARRYEMGEAPDFIKIPMILDSLSQILEWGPQNMQNYCRSIVQPIVEPLLAAGYKIGGEKMAFHLFGIEPKAGQNMNAIKEAIAKEKISVSYRRDIIRVSPSVYNTDNETNKLKELLIGMA